jgi:hypothetical protein
MSWLMAWVGHDWAQAEVSSPSTGRRFSFLGFTG